MAGGPLDLRGRVTIIDAGATRTLRSIGGAMSAVANRAKAVSTYSQNVAASTAHGGRRVAGRLGGIGGTGMGTFATAAGGAAFLRNESEYQEAMNRTQAVLNITDQQAFQPHRDLVVDLAKKYPATSAEIAKGASELAMAGMTLEQVNKVLEATVQGSMASGESIKTVGMGVTDVVMGLGKELTESNFNQINNVLAAAATSYAQDYTQFLSGFAKTAPLARMLGLDVNRLAGYLGILADAGFKAEKGGTAFRTSMINAAAPTPKAMKWLEQYGVVLSDFKKKVDTFQLGGETGAKALSDMVATELGVDSEGLDLSGILTPLLSDEKAFQDIPKLKKRLTNALSSAIGADDPENTKLIAKAVNSFVEAGFQSLDLDGLLQKLADTGFDQNVEAMKELFGKRFTAQMAAIINSLRDGTFNYKFDELFFPRIEGAVERFASILMQGLPGALKRLGGAFDGLMRSMASSGAIDTVVSALERLRDGINWLSGVSPTLLKGITLAILGLAVIAPVAMAISAVGAGLATLVAGVTAVAAMTGKIAGLTAALLGLGKAAKAAGKIQWLFGGAAAAGGAAAGGAAAGGAAVGAGAAKGAAKLGLRFLPGVGWVLAGAGALYAAYNAWSGGGDASEIATEAGLGAIGMDGGGQQTVDVGAPRIEGQAGGGNIAAQSREAVSAANDAAQQVQRIFGSIDLSDEGRRMMATLAAGITAGGAQAIAAANQVAAGVKAAGSRVQLNTGPNMQPAR